jgi:predicted  nucleic acid-binding Zn-ribbon protein
VGTSDTLVLEHLRHIRAVVDATREDVRELKHRVSAVEIALAGMRRDDAGLAEGLAMLGARTDRLSERIERVERRLDITVGG